MNQLAPIVLFTYNRLWHTTQTIEALQKNELSLDSELFIYCDGAKNEEELEKINEVRKYIATIDGFKNITIIERNQNWGLADNIIDGVTDIVNKYGKIIVLEDDIVTAKYFLQFMNEALDFYENKEQVFHIGGYVPTINFERDKDYFFNRTMYCWGWATWSNRWIHFSRDIDNIDNQLNTYTIIKKLNLDGTNNGVYEQFMANKLKKLKTWAVFWYINIFLNNGLCLIPLNSFTLNIGNDGSGTNCGNNERFETILRNFYNNEYPIEILEQEYTLEKLKLFYKG